MHLRRGWCLDLDGAREGVTQATFDVFGAQGGREGNFVDPGGLGGEATATIPVSPGDTLQVNVGGRGGEGLDDGEGGAGGFNGGADGGDGCCKGPGGGGGASDVRSGAFGPEDRIIVAGGGGGAGGLHGGGGGFAGGGGGGGSGFGPSGVVFKSGVRSGDGLVTITYNTTDTTAPTITPPSNITVEATGPDGAAVQYGTNQDNSCSASDIADPNPTISYSGGPPSGSTFPIGTTTITCTATDASGNSSSATFDVIVRDTTAPTTTMVLTPASPNGNNGWYTSAVRLALSATDGTGGSRVAETRCVLDPASAPTSFDELPSSPCPYLGSGADVSAAGQHILYAASSDTAGNEETPLVSRRFKIDTQAPTVTSTFPRNGREVGPAANIRATFSENMQEASVINAFKLFKKGSTNQIAAAVTYDTATHTATLDPTNNLRRGATYKAVVSTVAKDEAGNRLDQDGSRAGLQQKVWFFEIDN